MSIYNTSSQEYLTAVRNWGAETVEQPELFHIYWLQYERQPYPVLVAFGVFVAIVAVLSVLGNGLVCYTFLSSPTLRVRKMFVINVAFSDFISPLTTYHLFVISCFKGIWIFSKNVCIIYALVQGFCGLLSIVSLAAIALERHAAVTAPTSKFNNMEATTKLKFIVFIWFYCFLAVCPPLFGMGDYVSAGFLTTCCFDYINRDWKTRAFIVYLFTLGLGVPMLVIIYCYVNIGRMAQRSEDGYIKERFVLSRSHTQNTLTSLGGLPVAIAKNAALQRRHSLSRKSTQQKLELEPLQEVESEVSGREGQSFSPGAQCEERTESDGRVFRDKGTQTFEDMEVEMGAKGHLRRMSTVVTLQGVVDELSSPDKTLPDDMEVKITLKPRLNKQKSFWKTRNIRRDLDIARMMFVVIVSFMFAWMPYGVVALIGQFAPAGLHVSPWLAMVPSVCAKSSTLFNPVLYAYKDIRFKRGLRKYLLRQPQALAEMSYSATAGAMAPVGPELVKEVDEEMKD